MALLKSANSVFVICLFLVDTCPQYVRIYILGVEFDGSAKVFEGIFVLSHLTIEDGCFDMVMVVLDTLVAFCDGRYHVFGPTCHIGFHCVNQVPDELGVQFSSFGEVSGCLFMASCSVVDSSPVEMGLGRCWV